MTTANFPTWWDFCQQFDGSAHDDAVAANGQGDGAGTTIWGFIYPTWRLARRFAGYSDLAFQTFRAMSQPQAMVLAESFFWKRQWGEALAPGVDIQAIDWIFGSGGAVREIQRRLGFTGNSVDGLMGPATVGKISAMATAFIPQCYQWRVDYYDDCGFRQQWPGLYRRALECRQLAQRVAGVLPAPPPVPAKPAVTMPGLDSQASLPPNDPAQSG
jgi:lysozyme family protein